MEHQPARPDALPWDEAKRLAALRSYGILDTPLEQDFDDVVRIAAYVCNAPISVINLIDDDRQWFKAEIGLGVRETPLDVSICAHALPVTLWSLESRTSASTREPCWRHLTGCRSAPCACSTTRRVS